MRLVTLKLSLAPAAFLGIAVLALAFAVNNNAPSASATGATPTKIANDGTAGINGVSDVLVGDLATNTGLFYCIVKTDHEASTNNVKTAAQCNIDVPGQGDTGLAPPPWSDTDPLLANPSEPGPDLIAGPPPPPPYTLFAPSKGYGTYFPAGTAGCGNGSEPCVVTTSCFEDVGSPAGIGPNILATVTLPTAESTIAGVDRVATGTVDIWYNQNNTDCKAGTPAGTPDFDNLALFSIDAYEKGGANPNVNPAPWRPAAGGTVLDFDGDGCTDEQELSKTGVANCGDDPQNPSDSFNPATVDLSGIYDMTQRIARADDGVPGAYLYCRIDLQHNTDTDALTAIPFCYLDLDILAINSAAYPGVNGDGYAGAPPPGPCSDSTCANGDFAFLDVRASQPVFTGAFDPGTGIVTLSGCFEDQGTLGNVYTEVTISGHQLPGSSDAWLAQTLADCQNGTPVGDPTYAGVETSFVKPNPAKGKGYDQDLDGVPTERELDGTTSCGQRDPYNPYDYYDVSIPRDGVIDLPNDILGVILHFAPGGYPAGDENFDRGPSIINSAGNWNRHAPDGVIDLPNDILGVILQFNPGGCAATH